MPVRFVLRSKRAGKYFFGKKILNVKRIYLLVLKVGKPIFVRVEIIKI
ncbi:hypothetical protein KJA14_01665 [Patescibacteria group bacterium]|nr:hypothetical protein [Patescibacteria group bacterium]